MSSAEAVEKTFGITENNQQNDTGAETGSAESSTTESGSELGRGERLSEGTATGTSTEPRIKLNETNTMSRPLTRDEKLKLALLKLAKQRVMENWDVENDCPKGQKTPSQEQTESNPNSQH